MAEPKPCPFCDWEAEIISGTYVDGGYTENWAYVQCKNFTCKAKTQKVSECSPRSIVEMMAVSIWNTRAERTCEGCELDGLYANNCSFCNRDPRLQDHFIKKVVS